MKQELIGPTATLAAALLSKLENSHSEFTSGIVASAFEDAYFMLQEGIARVEKEEKRRIQLSPTDLTRIQEELVASGAPQRPSADPA